MDPIEQEAYQHFLEEGWKFDGYTVSFAVLFLDSAMYTPGGRVGFLYKSQDALTNAKGLPL